MHVSNALQKAKIEVSEDGTKASAATGRYLFSKALMLSQPQICTCDVKVSDMFSDTVCLPLFV